MEDERDAEYAIRGLDRKEFGRKGRRLRVEWTKVANVGNFYPYLALLLFVRFFFQSVQVLALLCLYCSMNVVLEDRVLQEDLRLIQDLQRPCLL